MSIVQALTDNLLARLEAAGVDTNGVHILGPGGAVAPEWGGRVFESASYPGWRLVVEAALTAQQVADVTAIVNNLSAVDYRQLVQDELRATIASLPPLMKTGTYADWLTWWNAQPHATAGERATRLETAQLQTWRLLIVIRDMVAAQYRAQALRESE